MLVRTVKRNTPDHLMNESVPQLQWTSQHVLPKDLVFVLSTRARCVIRDGVEAHDCNMVVILRKAVSTGCCTAIGRGARLGIASNLVMCCSSDHKIAKAAPQSMPQCPEQLMAQTPKIHAVVET